MKQICKISLLMAASLLLACNGSKDNPTPEPSPVVNPETRTLTFVLPDYPVDEGGEVSDLLKTQWVAGDQIVVHGEYAKDQVTVTLKASDISADGRKATLEVSGLYPYKRDDCNSDLYAEWPASAVTNLKHCFFYSCFGPENAQMLAACNENNQFNFHNLSSIISFRVEGDFDSYTLGARRDVPIGYEFYQVKITDKEQNFRQYLGNVSTTVTFPVEADGFTDNIYYIPGGANLIAGYSIRFIKDEKIVMAYTNPDPLNLTIGSVVDLGDITDLLEEFDDPIDPDMAQDLSLAGTANCYVVYQAGTYKFPAVKGNSTELVGAVDATKIIWETWGNDEEVQHKSVVKTTMYDNGIMYFQLAEDFHPGNALIAALDKEENILWSWHIWVPETEFTSDGYGFISGYTMMSRNLGALIDAAPGSLADSRSFGLLYQWGRKDPFLAPQAAGSTDPATRYGDAMKVKEGQLSPAEAIANPTTFAAVEGEWNTEENMMYWGDVERSSSAPKGVMDPCPPGYRVIGRKRAASLFNASDASGISGWLYDADHYILQMGSPVVTFPIGGYIDSKGAYVPDASVVWDSHGDLESLIYSYGIKIADGKGGKSQQLRSVGGSIRCEAE